MLLADRALESLCTQIETDKITDPRVAWRKKARPSQVLPEGIWRICFWRGGRGSGKTASGASGLAEWVLNDTDGEGEYGIIAPTYADAWTKCVEGEAGILRALGTSMAEIKDHRSATVRSAWRTYGQVVMHNGIIIYVDSAAEGGLRIQGRNLKGAWCDEIGLWLNWETAWNESLRYAVRKGEARILATGTPKASRPARKLVRSLLENAPEHGGVVNRQLFTEDNLANLSESFYRSVVGANQGTRLERQELFGDLLEDVEGALWRRELLEQIQCEKFPNGDLITPGSLVQVYIGVDPSDGDEGSDEQAYTVMGRGPGGLLYVVDNWGGQIGPVPFARKAIAAAALWNGTLVVEKNHGGAWLMSTLRQVATEMIKEKAIGRMPAIEVVWASKGKRTRAEPVAALYERNGGELVHHKGPFVELEDQMATFTGVLTPGTRSPDRLDSLVWAATKYLRMDFSGTGTQEAIHEWAAARELARMAQGSAQQQYMRRMAALRQGTAAYDHERKRQVEGRSSDWGIDSFAPQTPDEEQLMSRQSGDSPAVFGWSR